MRHDPSAYPRAFAHAPGDEARCEAAAAHVAYLIDAELPGPIVFSEEVPFVPLSEGQGRWFTPAERIETQGPASALWDAFRTEPVRNAVTACPNVRALLDARGIAYGDKAVTRAIGNGKRRKWRAVVLNVILPTLNEDGTEGIVVSTRSSGPLGGGGYAFYLRRDGAWQPIAATGLYVS